MAILDDPRDAVLQNDPLVLQPDEQRLYDQLSAPKDHRTLEAIALTLGGAFLFQHMIASRMLKERFSRVRDLDVSTARLIASVVYQTTIPRWLGIATPALVSGYRRGVAEAAMGQIPEDQLYEMAEAYAKDLGEHLNEVSTRAMLEGFQAQINRKVPAARAAQQVAEAYGVPPRGMNALVSLWNSEDPRALTKVPVKSFKDARITRAILGERTLRSKQVGEAEAWGAKSQAKQIVWMYGMQEGIIPEDAARVWHTAKDEKVCKYCGPMHRKQVNVGEPFKTAQGEVWAPPLHINCRCDIELDFQSSMDFEAGLNDLLKQPVRKAFGGDQYDRDKTGRFAATESRRTKTKELWDDVHEPSISEQIQAQMNALQDSMKLEKPEPLQKLTSGKLTKLEKHQPLVKPLVKPANSLDRAAGTLERTKLERPKLGMSPLQKQQIKHVLSKIPKPLDKIIETEDGTWVPSDVPMLSIIPKWEMGADDDFVMTDYEQSYEVRDRIFGGLDTFYQALDMYWDEEGQAMLQQFYEEGGYHWVAGDDEYEIDHDAYYDAITEAMHRIPKQASSSIVLESANHPGKTIAVKVSDLVEYLALDDWVEEIKPSIVVTNHLNQRGAERLGQGRWTNPGKFRKSKIQGEDIDVGHMPHDFWYAEPAD